MPITRARMLLGKLLRQCTKRLTAAPWVTPSEELAHFRLLAGGARILPSIDSLDRRLSLR
jgi:hypothetical protein